jgi:hypothetical protein
MKDKIRGEILRFKGVTSKRKLKNKANKLVGAIIDYSAIYSF